MSEQNNKVTAKSTKENIEVTVEYDFGSTLAEMVDKFGEEVVRTNSERNMIVTLQSNMRRLALGTEKVPPKSPEEIQEWANSWKPGEVTRTGKSKVEKASALVEGMSDEEKKELLKLIRAQKKAEVAD